MQLLKHNSVQSPIESFYIEEEPRESRKGFQTLFNLMPDPVVIVDGKGNFLAVNDKVEEKTGFKREELLGKNFLKTKIVTAKSKTILIKNLTKRMMGMHVAPYEVEVLTKDDKKLTVDVNATKIEYDEKPADLVIFRDITERKRAEDELRRYREQIEKLVEERTAKLRRINEQLKQEIAERKRIEDALRESEERYRKQFDEALDAIFLADAETGIIIDCNRAACDLVGREKSELVGKHQRILHPPQKIEGGFSRTFKQHLKEKEGQILETQIVTKKGEIKDVAIKANVFELGDKKIVQGIFRDITEGKSVEAALTYERDLLYALMNNIPDTIYFKDTASRFTTINKAQAKMLGIENQEEALGKTDFDFFTKEHAQDAYADEQKIMKTGQPLINKTEKTERPDGYILWTSTTKVPIKDKEGQLIGMVGISRDVTERKQMQEKLEEYSEHLEELVKERTRQLIEAQEQLIKAEKLAAIGEVAGMVGHDLRNPLQVIVSTVYLAKKSLKDLPSSGRKFTEKHGIEELLVTVGEQVDYMNKIVSDLQDYARPLKPELVETSLHKLINDTLSTITVPETVKVSVVVEEDFPKLMIDFALMKRVLINLITNAL